MRIACNAENARLSARGFDHCGEPKGIGGPDLTVLQWRSGLDEFVAGRENRHDGLADDRKRCVAGARSEENISGRQAATLLQKYLALYEVLPPGTNIRPAHDDLADRDGRAIG